MTALPPSRSKSAQRAAEIADAVEDEIIFGTLRPHMELSEDTLIARFDAKRHVVRQAIGALVDRQIVTKPPNRSARVKDFTPKEVSEIYDMRELLQREAIMRLEFPSRSDLSQIEDVRQAHEDACASSDLRRIHRLNDDFHAAIFGLCPNRTLSAEVARYNQMTNAIRSLGIADQALRNRALHEHAQMVDALREQDRDGLARLCVSHMQPTKDKWLALRAAVNGEGRPDDANL